MISFNNLGNLGQLGNQMFQYAGLKGIATHKKYQYSIPTKTIDITKCFEIPSTQTNTNTTIVQSNSLGFDSYFFDNCPNNVDIIDFFQTEKYFAHIKNQIREDFTFKADIIKNCKKYIKSLQHYKEMIGLHIRRKDYIKNKVLVSLDLQYYFDALKLLNNSLPVMIFSDDKDWCKQQKLFNSNRFIISSLTNAYEDLCCMSMCQYHIIANSSYSWWGAWLAQSKKVIAPKKWYTDNAIKDINTKNLYQNGKMIHKFNFKYWNTEDLYLKDWIVI